ncbi:hypothetical protein ECH_0258 [Ehrlichia chaffeensis str. Arkansas]|uniref:Uncharacterized protein n=1 Tax=Ehrlichia chaffeensis (strain ATCC CRL-10679 / Arkansas) TaxID=205920 RepID=Q2GHK4_EHRCR|nr:hypothetical protein ECH_0258 [Ehrlichia chaffeensis str. Arkansas]
MHHTITLEDIIIVILLTLQEDKVDNFIHSVLIMLR